MTERELGNANVEKKAPEEEKDEEGVAFNIFPPICDETTIEAALDYFEELKNRPNEEPWL